MKLEAMPLAAGEAAGPLVRLDEALSFWGGFDPGTGTVVDRGHPQFGTRLTGKIVVVPGSRGSSSSSAVLAEAIRTGSGPLGIIIRDPDTIVVLGAIAAAELYQIQCPVVRLVSNSYELVGSATEASISADAATAFVVVPAATLSVSAIG